MYPFELSPATRNLIGMLSTLDAQTSQDKLYRRVQELEYEIRLLKGHHNTTVPIARLPPEILSRIFQCLLTDSARSYVPYRTRLSPDVVHVTHVCTYWREIALECTDLWNNLDFGVASLTNAMIDRSKDALIKVQYNAHTRLDIGDHFRQILQRLGNEKKNISELWLSHIDLPLRMLPIRNTITELTLCSIPGTTTAYRPSLKEFREVLGEMPRLQFLQLEEYLPASDTSMGEIDALEPTPLCQSLQSVNLTDWVNNLTQFFRAFQMPKGLGLDIDHYANSQQSDVNNLFSSVPYSLGYSGARVPVRRLNVLDRRFEIYPPSDPTNLNPLLIRVEQQDAYGEQPQEYDTFAYMENLSSMLDFSSLTKIHVLLSDPAFWDHDAWSCFGKATNVKTIIFQKSPLVGFLGALGEAGTPGHAELLFPALATIQLASIHLGDEGAHMEEIVSLLISALQRRIDCGRPIKRLRLDRLSCFYRSDFNRIREEVPSLDVLWDEVVTESSPSDWGSDDDKLITDE